MKPGDKVVCIDDRWDCPFIRNNGHPISGNIYTIHEIQEWPAGTGLVLKEFNWIVPGVNVRCVWLIDYFRPLNLVDHFDSEAYLEWLERVLPELEPIEK